MGLFDELRRLARPYEDEPEDDYEDDFEPVSRSERMDRTGGDRLERKSAKSQAAQESTGSLYSLDNERRSNKVVNIHTTTQLQVVLDFLSGVAYANEGKIKKVAISTYIITPYNVDILGDLIDELENNGLYF